MRQTPTPAIVESLFATFRQNGIVAAPIRWREMDEQQLFVGDFDFVLPPDAVDPLLRHARQFLIEQGIDFVITRRKPEKIRLDLLSADASQRVCLEFWTLLECARLDMLPFLPWQQVEKELRESTTSITGYEFNPSFEAAYYLVHLFQKHKNIGSESVRKRLAHYRALDGVDPAIDQLLADLQQNRSLSVAGSAALTYILARPAFADVATTPALSRLARVRESGKRLSLSLSRHNRFIYFVGPDGVGKTTLIKQTRKALPRSRYFRFKNSYRRSPFYSLLWRTRRYYLRRKHGRRLVKNQVDASMARVLFWVSVNSLFWRNLVALVTGRTLLSDRSPADLALEGHRTDDLISLRDGAPLFAMPPGRAMIHLHAAPDVILARKQEMSESQIRSYQDALFEAYLQRPAPLYISVATDNPVAQCVATITAGLGVGTNALQ